VDLVARCASPETVASSPRATPCPSRRPWRGARSFPGDVGNGSRMEARQGAMRIFFRNPIVFRSASQPAIRLYLMRDPVSRPLARSQRECAGLLAFRDFARSRIRCSWRLGPVRFRQTSPPPADDGDGHGGPPQKNSHGPSLRPHRPRNQTFHARCPTRNGEAPHWLRECRQATAEPRRRTTTRLACNQIDDDPESNTAGARANPEKHRLTQSSREAEKRQGFECGVWSAAAIRSTRRSRIPGS
jgi:hypothetical protein